MSKDNDEQGNNDQGNGNSSYDFHVLASKGLFDQEFCERLLADPESALQEVGIQPTDEILEALKNVDVESVKKLAEAFGADTVPGS